MRNRPLPKRGFAKPPPIELRAPFDEVIQLRAFPSIEKMHENDIVFEEGRRIGHYRVGPGTDVLSSAKLVELICDCRHREVMSMGAALRRVKEKESCCTSPDCSVMGMTDFVWRSTQSARAQLHVLHQVCRKELPSWWGGGADDAYEFEWEEQASVWEAYLQTIERPAGMPWIRRRITSKPFAEGNVVMGRVHDPIYRRAPGCKLNVDGEWITMTDLRKLTGLPTSRILLEHFLVKEDLMIHLLTLKGGMPHEIAKRRTR